MRSFDPDEWGVWSWRGVLTQDDVGGGALRLSVSAGAGNELRILQFHALFSGTNTLDVQTRDEDGNLILNLVDIASVATPEATLPRAATGIDSTTSSDDAASLSPVRLAGADLNLSAVTGGAAQTNTLTVLILALCRKGPGTVVSTGSAGTPSAIAVSVNEVY